MFCLCLVAAPAPRAQAEPTLEPYPLKVLWREGDDPARRRWTVAETNRSRGRPASPLGRVVVARYWPEGLVGLFAIENEGRISLRRLPPVGRENFSEPLFFALPPSEDREALRLSGRWRLESRSREGQHHRLAMDWSVLGDQASGRLDQDTDFRFAYLTGARWKDNRLDLTVEYIADRYAMSGTWDAGRMRGTWKQIPEGNEGTWEAVRPPPESRVPSDANTLPLYEWRRGSERACEVGDARPGDGWIREPSPLCRIWPLEPSPDDSGFRP